MQGADVKDLCQHTLCLSSDVNAAYDPTFGDVFEANNSCYINKGCVLTKYTGGPRQICVQRCKRRDHGEGDRNYGGEWRVLAGR